MLRVGRACTLHAVFDPKDTDPTKARLDYRDSNNSFGDYREFRIYDNDFRKTVYYLVRIHNPRKDYQVGDKVKIGRILYTMVNRLFIVGIEEADEDFGY